LVEGGREDHLLLQKIIWKSKFPTKTKSCCGYFYTIRNLDGRYFKKEFHWAKMVESMSSCRINYISYHLGIFIYQGGMERGRNDDVDKEIRGR
jgi:hypothetical protein